MSVNGEETNAPELDYNGHQVWHVCFNSKDDCWSGPGSVHFRSISLDGRVWKTRKATKSRKQICSRWNSIHIESQVRTTPERPRELRMCGTARRALQAVLVRCRNTNSSMSITPERSPGVLRYYSRFLTRQTRRLCRTLRRSSRMHLRQSTSSKIFQRVIADVLKGRIKNSYSVYCNWAEHRLAKPFISATFKPPSDRNQWPCRNLAIRRCI